MAHGRASESRRPRRHRVSRVLLASADVNVVNRTTLSLWHFQQLAQQLLPRAATADEPETDAEFAPPVETAPEWPPAVALHEGMRVAAVAFEAEGQADASDGESTDDSDVERDTQVTTQQTTPLPSPNTLEDARLVPATEVGVVYSGYRCVVCLDASPSSLSIDPATGRLFLDMLYESVELFIWGLLRPMTVGADAFEPEIHLSVMVQGAHVESLSVLVQGYIVNARNATQLLQMIKDRVRLIEDDWAVRTRDRDHRSVVESQSTGSTRASLSWMLQNAVFAVNSLPGSAAPLLVVVTDGVVDLSDAYSYDNLLMQLVRHDIQCSFLRVGGVGGDSALNASFGFVPDVDLLEFIASTTGGAVFDYVALHAACYGPREDVDKDAKGDTDDRVQQMSALQAACFLRLSSVHAIASPVMKLDELCCTSFDGRTLLPLRPYRMWREKVHEYRIFADVERIIEARIREGFTINKVHVKTSAQPASAGASEAVAGASTKRGPGPGPASTTTDSPRGVESSASASASEGGDFQDVTKILVVFLLQWKQNVWLEYVVSTTIESDVGGAGASTPAGGGRRQSSHGLASGFSSSAKKLPHDVFKKEQTYEGKWSEWYVKVNILAYADFLRAFEDSAQLAGGGGGGRHQLATSGSPRLLHEFIRSVQDVDRVLLHLVTAVATAIASADAGSQYSFGVIGNAASSAAHSRQQSAHPVFNIIGELTPVLWHRWFYVERFELLCVVKNEANSDVFYRNEDRDVSADRARKGLVNPSRGFLQLHQGGYRVHTVAIGVERITERLLATLQKWSSQRLSKDLFLRFLHPTSKERHLLRNKASAASTAGVGRRQQLRPAANAQSGWQAEEPASIDGGSSSSLCFVRLEIKSKTLCAVHVAFFSTPAAARKHTLGDLKATIIAGVNEVVPTPLVAPDQAPAPTKTVVLTQRLISRLLVTHETLLLHDGVDGTGAPHDHTHWETSGGQAVSTCCGGSELQLRSVFGAYMWHSNWRWHIANPTAMLNVMRRLHDARVESGFWVLDWRMESDDESQASQLQSIIFGREIVMEDENGNAKTSLVQYALRRVSESCLMTSIWMEPQHGTVKTQLSSHVEPKDRFHWSLRHAVGHNTPFEEFESASKQSSEAGKADVDRLEEERKTMVKEDGRVDVSTSMYLGENDLLQLIRGYIFKSDRHFLSCLYTFDCVVNYHAAMPHQPHVDKEDDGDENDVVGSAWNYEMFGVAALKQLLPPFSTARLLRSAKRSTERFLMYLESGADEAASAVGDSATTNSPRVSLANEHLYSMLERTLRGLSDCEVAWTDSSGNVVSEDASLVPPTEDGDELIKEGMTGQMPLWLKEHISLSFQDDVPPSALSEGRCFAKLVGDDTVVLAFLPSLETLQVRKKSAAKSTRRSSNSPAAPLPDNNNSPAWSKAEPRTARGSPPASVQTPAMEPSANSRLLRMSVSADDIVLYQERRLSFREGYKSWRMGHYQGSRDDKQSTGSDFRTAHQASASDDHEFCAELSQQTAYGCDFHVLIANDSGAVRSGFFQVAFYECSVTCLSSFQGDSSNRRTETASRFDLPQLVLKKLFVSSPTAAHARDDATVAVHAGKEGGAVRGSLASPAAAAASPSGTLKPATAAALLSASSVVSRRFQKKVKRAHEHNFSRGVYIALREGSHVQQSDLLQALTSCVEIPVDLDITLLYRMMQASSPKHGFESLMRGSAQSALKARLDKAFESIMAAAFVPIPGTKYYYFTGSEVVAFEDVGGEESEYELQVLMDDSEEVSSSAVVDDDMESTTGASGATLVADGRAGADSSFAKAFSSASKPPLAKASPRASGVDMARGAGGGRRLKDQRRPPPVKTTPPRDVQLMDQLPGVEEDAEFNKEVAVATSSFSAPFFFRFECREVSNLHATEAGDLPPPAARDSLQRSVSTQSFIGMRNEWLANTQAKAARGSPDDVSDESLFNALLLSKREERREKEVAHVAEWFEKAPSTRIALRLVTLTLPNEQGAFLSRHHSPSPNQPRTQFDMDDSVHGAKHAVASRAQAFSALPLFQRQALKRVRQNIKEWCSMEVLAILRAANSITPAISQLVQQLFEDLPAHALTTATYPLGFVTSSSVDTTENPVELLKKELERGNAFLCVHHASGVYFVVDPKEWTETDAPDVKADQENFEIPFWAFFTVENDRISLRLHHPDQSPAASTPAFDRLSVLTRLHLGVLEACKRVNQYLLLLQLHETRSCSDILLPAPSNQVSSPRSPRRKDSGSASFGSGATSEPFFWPGQFQCELQYSALFKLHERLSPTVALNMLCTSALEQFQVHNRRHVFVYRDRGGHVFYMKMSIKQQEQATEGDKPDRKRGPRLGISNGSGPSGAGGTPSPASSSAGVAGILLEVFGVSAAGDEVAQELCRVLERKLDEATQLILMKLLARNAKFQLSASDMAFVCPPDGRPTQVLEFVLPTKFADAASLLQFLSQTLSSATYVRNMSNAAGASSRGLGDAAGELGVALGGRRRSILGPEKEPVSERPQAVRAHDPALSHPSMFFVVDDNPVVESSSSSTDPEMVSPVFLSPRGTSRAGGAAAPVVEDQASFVLNLNPELRLSPGFLSRIGKGLAVFRIELIRNHMVEAVDKEDDDEHNHTVKSLEDFDSVEVERADEESGDASGLRRVVRCQIWIRGSIVASELAQLLESNLREAMLDYQIEATLKAIADRVGGAHATPHPLPEPPASVSTQEVQYLTSLFEKSWHLSSATVTKLRFPSPIALWDVQHVVQQLQSFLQCMPPRLRPSTFAKATATSEYAPHDVDTAGHGELWSETSCRQYLRMIPRLQTGAGDFTSNSEPPLTATDRLAASHHSLRSLSLYHSDSIQSEMSDMADKLSLPWALSSSGASEFHKSGFNNQLVSSTGALPAAAIREFSENELLHYQKQCLHAPASTGSNVDATAPADSECCTRRSFYYVIEVSCSGGVQVHGYNMSAAVVDALLVQLARILTWSKLREALVRTLLLEKSGLPHAAPLGWSVVQPRELYVSGRGSAVGKTSFLLPKDFSVSFVEFWKPAVEILTGNAAFPRLLDATLLRLVDGSSLGKYLREAHTLASDQGDMHRPRAPSNASLKAAGPGLLSKPELHRDVSSQSSSRSLRGIDTSGPSMALSASGRSGSSTGLKLERSAPSPTKRGVTGGGAGLSGYNGSGPSGGGGAAAPRMRGNAGAATALLAARARARGALPGRPGGGPGASSKPASGDAVAPWDLPLTNTKGPVLTGSGAPTVPRASPAIDAAGATTGKAAASGLPTGDDIVGSRRLILRTGSASVRELRSPLASPANSHTGSTFGSSFSRPGSLEPNDAASVSFSWRKQLEFAWGPRYKYHDSVASQARGATIAKTTTDDDEKRRTNPLGHLSEALQTRWQQLEDRSTSHSVSLNLFEKLVHMGAGDEMDEAVSLSIVRRMMQSGHELVRQRFRVTFVERWEVVKVDDEYMEADMQDGRLRALQASMDLVNLLSYKKEFVFAGNACTIANFYTEHTVVGMCASEGDAVREMKKQIMKNIFQLRMEVAHAFYEQYAVQLRALGFRHLSTLANQSSVSVLRSGRLGGPSASASASSLAALSVGSAFGADSDGFAEYFYFPGKAQGKLKGWQANATTGHSAAPASLLLLELKSDHHGVQLSVVLVHERDLAQHALGFQSHLASTVSAAESRVSGELVVCVAAWLRDALRTRAIIYSFTIRFFQNYLTKWSNDQREREPASHDDVGSATDPDATAALAASASMSSLSASAASLLLSGHDVHSFQNIVKGIRCFLQSYPEPPSTAATSPTLSRASERTSRASVLRTAVVELPPTQLHSNCSESILVKILLRYIACHGARYEVLDLMQFGTPDAVVCHSPSGSFFHRQPATGGPTPFGYLPPREHFAGYSLLITTQSVAEGFGLQARDKKRRKNCIQLILLKGAGATAAVSVLPVERALLEAEFFVQELFRVAAQHYERDLLWSRLLYDDTTGPGARVAATLALPVNHFQVEVGPQQLEECLRLSVCTPLDEIDPTLAQLLDVDSVCWQEFALRLRDMYADQLREYQFDAEQACHFLLLCPNTHDLIIHLTFESGVPEPPLLDFGSASSTSGTGGNGGTGGNDANGGESDGGRVKIEICRREEPPNRTFTFAQRRVITDFVNSIVHWQWRSLLYD